MEPKPDLNPDPLRELKWALWHGKDTPVWVAVSLTDMQPVWDAYHDAYIMLSLLARVDVVRAARCACAYARRSIHLDVVNEARSRRLIDECERWLDRRDDVTGVLEILHPHYLTTQKDDRPVSAFLAASAATDIGFAVASIANVSLAAVKKSDWEPAERSAFAVSGACLALANYATECLGLRSDSEESYRIVDAYFAEAADVVRVFAPAAPRLEDLLRTRVDNRQSP